MTAQLTVQVGDVPARANQARDIATDIGGNVVGDDRTSDKNSSATLTLKVPPSQLPDVMKSLSGLGKEQSRHQSTQDVTTEVADVDSRIKSAQASIDRLITLYSSATKVGDIISIERELAEREAQLESLEAQQHALQSQTTMATVTLRLTTKAVAPPAKHHRSGFLGGLSRGWHGFTDASVAVLTGVGVLLPFVVLLLVVGAATVVIRRRWPRSLPEPSTGDPA